MPPTGLTRISIAALALGLALVCAETAAAQCGSSSMTLNDSEGFIWDITDNGGVSNGTSDAYDCGMSLKIDGTFFSTATRTMELSGRQLVHGPATMGSLSVTRRAYVPMTEGWARFMEYLENPTGAAVTATVLLESNLGADSRTMVIATSSGDTSYTTADRWVTTDDSTASGGDPTTGHNYWGAGALAPTVVSTTVSFSSAGMEGPTASFDVTIPPGGTAILLYFATQNMGQPEAAAKAMMLDTLPATALTGVDGADLARIVNWPTGGASLGPGEPCASSVQCLSGFCVDAVCCDRACDGVCEACSVAQGGLADGRCVRPPAGCLDAGMPGPDAGPGFDAGPSGFDAGRRDDDGGPPRVDAEPRRTRGERRGGGCCSVAANTEGAPAPWWPGLALGAVVAWRLRRRADRG